MSSEVDQLLPQLYDAIDADREGFLPLGWRLALWRAMVDTFGPEAEPRRNILAFAVAKDLLPLWTGGKLTCGPLNYDRYFSHPARGLEVCRRYLRGEIPLDIVEKQCEAMGTDMDDALYYSAGTMDYAYVAVLQVFDRIFKGDDDAYEDRDWYELAKDPDNRTEIREALFGEMEWCETHYWASEAAVYVDDNDVYHPTPETYARRRVFWHAWVRSSLPRVLGTMEACLAVLEEP